MHGPMNIKNKLQTSKFLENKLCQRGLGQSGSGLASLVRLCRYNEGDLGFINAGNSLTS
jgi:hypothetical protein